MVVHTSPLIQVKDVSKRYNRGQEVITALAPLSLDIQKGELLAIVGPSGSGKTTLSHIIGGLITPDSGSVTINGKPLNLKSDKAISHYRNAQVGFIFQSFSLIGSYTALQNVMIPLIVANVAPRKRRALAEQYLKLVGLEKRSQHRADTLSGGERQRVSIARALVNKPQIIIADEPTGNLDSKRGDEIMKILETLSHQHGISVLMVTHDTVLAKRADRIISIKDGVMEVSYANR
ncbi:MAG TPA: ABC transporter ATP-binding protein [Candidatus Microsaccharimonas sp.]|jgi:putative ABC transport system ATP-binding protein